LAQLDSFAATKPWPPLQVPRKRSLGLVLRRAMQRIDFEWTALRLCAPRDLLPWLLRGVRRVYERLARRAAHGITRNAEVNRRLRSDYVPKPYPGPVTLFRGRTKRFGNGEFDPTHGWGPLVSAGLEIHELPGFHTWLLEEPFVPFLATAIQNRLAEARAHSRPPGRVR
jgi:hypothetical protein